MWCGFLTSTVIGLLFFDEMRDSGFVTVSMTGEMYADTLQNHSLLSLADKYLLGSTIFMQNNVPSYIARLVKDLLSLSFCEPVF